MRPFHDSPTRGHLLHSLKFLLIALTLAESATVAVRYVRLADKSAKLSQPCGDTESDACATLALALDLSASSWHQEGSNDFHTTVILLPSNYDRELQNESIANASDVTFDASQAGLLDLVFYPEQSGGQPWLEVVNSSNIALIGFNVSLSGFNGSAAVLLEGCYNVTLQLCTFTAPALNSRALLIINCWPLKLLASSFTGAATLPSAPGLQDSYNLSSVMMSYTCDASTCPLTNPAAVNGVVIDEDCCLSLPALSGASPTIVVDGCEFHRLGINPIYKIYYRTMWEEAVTIHLETFSVRNLTATISNCKFLDNTSPYDTNMKAYFGAHTLNSTLEVINSVFSGSWCYIGCAVFFRVEPQAEYNQIIVRNNTFFNNSAYIEGGAVAVSVFSTSNSAIIADNIFIDNSGGPLSGVGQVGGAVSLICTSSTAQSADVPQYSRVLAHVQITNCTFNANSASYGSAIFLRGVYAQLQHMNASNNYRGSCIWAQASYVFLSGEHLYENNTQSLNGGVFTLAEFSVLKMDKDVGATFAHNSAFLSGGVVYADESSSTADIAETLQFATNIGAPKPCFFDAQNFSEFNYNGTSNHGKVTFVGNDAREGQVVYANSFTPCFLSDSPITPDVRTLSGVELNVQSMDVASGPAWMFFKNATCGCLKPVPNDTQRHWFHRYNCDQMDIMMDMNTSDLVPPALVDAFYQDANHSFVHNPDVSGAGVFPALKYFLSPWATTTYQWYYPRLASPFIDSQLDKMTKIFTRMSNVTLYPAPGEEFSLQLDVAGALFDKSPATISLRVLSGQALIRQEDRQFSKDGVIYFGSYSSIKFSLAGVPGAVGELVAATTGQIRSSSLYLHIPFRLRPCRFGFEETPLMSNSTNANAYINSFKMTLLTPANTDYTDKLICSCPQNAGVDYCYDGKFVAVKWKYWAGDTSSMLYDPTELNPERVIENVDSLEGSFMNRTFAVAECLTTFCSDHDKKSWLLGKTSPCERDQHRYGVLCGKCQANYSLTGSLAQTCVQCSHKDAEISLAGLGITLFLYSIFFLALLTYFNVGWSPKFDAWLNFDQICYFTTRRDIPIMSLSSGNTPFCIGEDMDALAQVGLLYFFPVLLLFCIFIIFQLSKVTCVRRLVFKYSMFPTLWASLTFSYAILLYPSFLLLSCQEFQNHQVFIQDASIRCFTGQHVPYVVIAFFIIFFIGIPAPLVLFFMRSSPRIKPFIDVYLSYMRDDRSWWAAVSVFRRMFITVLSVFLQDPGIRQLVLAIAVNLLMLLHFVLQPYRNASDNIVEALLLGFAGVYAILNMMSPADVPSWFIVFPYMVLALPTACLLLGGIYRERARLRHHLGLLCKCFACFRSCKSSRHDEYMPLKGDTSRTNINDSPPTESTTMGRSNIVANIKPSDLREEVLFDELQNMT